MTSIFGFCNSIWVGNIEFLWQETPEKKLSICEVILPFIFNTKLCVILDQFEISSAGLSFCPSVAFQSPAGGIQQQLWDCVVLGSPDLCGAYGECSSCAEAGGCGWCASRGDCRSLTNHTNDCGGCAGLMLQQCNDTTFQQETAKQEWVIQFEEADINGDYVIELDEFHSTIGTWVPNGKWKTNFQLIDTNQDDEISLTEFFVFQGMIAK